MIIKERKLQGVYEIRLSPRYDHRGCFARVYDEPLFSSQGLHRPWVQENQSVTSKAGTIRGLHFQHAPHTETKLVRAARGAIWDVFVDLRFGSPTFGEWDSIELTESNNTMIYIPKGFAHGFCTLSDDCLVVYKVDQMFIPEADAGIRWNDSDVDIAWPVQAPILSAKDAGLPTLRQFVQHHEGLIV